MRASAITLLIATGLWAMACGSGESPSNAGRPQPLENGTYQKPPSSYQDPPSTGQPSDYQKPPSTYERPGGGSGTAPMPGPGATLCHDLCAMAAANDCASELENKDDIAALPPAQCIDECNGRFDGFGCAIEIAGVSTCVLHQLGELDCMQLEQIGEGKPNNIPREVRDACSDSIASLSGCLDGLEPGDGGDCTVSGRCVCNDDCEHCRCENLGDDGPCTACRNNNN